jgi:hypothetical protein
VLPGPGGLKREADLVAGLQTQAGEPEVVLTHIEISGPDRAGCPSVNVPVVPPSLRFQHCLREAQGTDFRDERVRVASR